MWCAKCATSNCNLWTKHKEHRWTWYVVAVCFFPIYLCLTIVYTAMNAVLSVVWGSDLFFFVFSSSESEINWRIGNVWSATHINRCGSHSNYLNVYLLQLCCLSFCHIRSHTYSSCSMVLYCFYFIIVRHLNLYIFFFFVSNIFL